MYNIRLQFELTILRKIKMLSAFKDVSKKELLESLVIEGLNRAEGSGEIPRLQPGEALPIEYLK